jgi:hypothetical protein
MSTLTTWLLKVGRPKGVHAAYGISAFPGVRLQRIKFRLPAP